MPVNRTWRYWLAVALATVWLLIICSVPVLHPSQSGWTEIVYEGFSRVCHQQPDRSLHLVGAPMPVCARCSGLYVGLWAGLLGFPYLRRLATVLVGNPRWLIVFAIPLLIDVFSPNTEASRFITGGLASFPMALFVWLAADQLGPALSRRSP